MAGDPQTPEDGKFERGPQPDAGRQGEKNVRRQPSPRISERRRARQAALQVLYEVDAANHQAGPVLDARQRHARLSPEGLSFLRWLVGGVVAHKDDMDKLIGRYAPEWPVQQLAVVDRNILRLAIFELVNPESDAPMKVVINEAVELAKLFGSDSSPRFVNGVLATALRELASSDS